MTKNIPNIPAEKFEFVNTGANIHDEKFKTKSRGYFSDAFLRFKKNKSSVVAAFIIAFLVLFSIIAPVISPYTVNDKDNTYTNFPPYIESVANANLGILDGSRTFNGQNEKQLAKYNAIAFETGYNPIIGDIESYDITELDRGREVVKTYYNIKLNCYYMIGAEYDLVSYDEFKKIQA